MGQVDPPHQKNEKMKNGEQNENKIASACLLFWSKQPKRN